MKLERVYHPYWKWEDWENGLYDIEKTYSEIEEEVGGTCGYMWLKALNKVQGWIIDSLHNNQSIPDNDPIDYNLN